MVQHFGDREFSGITLRRVGFELAGDVRREFLISCRALSEAAARADLARSVVDDEDSLSAFSPAAGIDSCALGWVRHAALHASIAVRVTRCLPAISSATSCPLRMAPRTDETVDRNRPSNSMSLPFARVLAVKWRR
jgi:hypothetical protein